MAKYFNVNLEFDHEYFHEKIHSTIAQNKKGYICVVDANVLTMAQRNSDYREVLNSSMMNTCDGGSIAACCGLIHGKDYHSLNGPEFFEEYIEKPYKHLLLGSTDEIVLKIKNTLSQRGLSTDNIHHIGLPFIPVDQYDYEAIAMEINKLKPDIIWVSLGAPKQDFFMNNISPYIDRGVLLGIGAAFNFYTGDINLPTYRIGAFRFLWLSRLIHEPVKIGKRILPYIFMMPKLCWEEYKKVHFSN